MTYCEHQPYRNVGERKRHDTNHAEGCKRKRTAGFHLIPSSISHWGASTLPLKLMIHINHRKRRDAANRIGAVEQEHKK
nr:MAG TPA: hypothetical protein [Caudoviricetes sp.]